MFALGLAELCHISKNTRGFIVRMFSSGCWHSVWIPGGRYSSHPVCPWGLSLWDISEAKEVQRTCAGTVLCVITICLQLLGVCILAYLIQDFCWCVLFQMSCHPELNQYIQDTLHCIKPLIEKVSFVLKVTGQCHTKCHLISPLTALISFIRLLERCREGGCGHHGQRASSSREICFRDFPATTALHQVALHILMLTKNKHPSIEIHFYGDTGHWLLFVFSQLRHVAVTRGAAAEGVHPEDQRVWCCFK